VTYPGRGLVFDNEEIIHHLNLLYARDYRVADDGRMLWSYLRS
jgi:hypothetical protein